ncbi:MAG: GRP family sugar transporter [Candidatus Moraniibacteriota bacterium]
MLEIFQYWQVNLVLAILFMVIFNQSYRLIAKKSEDTASMLIVVFSVVSAVFVLLIPFFKMKLPMDWTIYAWLVLAILFYTVNDRFKAVGFKHLDVSEVSVLTQLSKVFLMLYGVFIFKEYVSLENAIGAILIILGGIIITFKKGVFVFNKYVVLLIVAALAMATALSIDVAISKHFNLALYLLVTFALPAVIVFVVERKDIHNLKKEYNLNKDTQKHYFITGISFAFAILFYLMALRQGQVSVVAPLSSVVVALNVLVGYLFLKEKNDPIKRSIAAILVIIGVFLLV